MVYKLQLFGTCSEKDVVKKLNEQRSFPIKLMPRLNHKGV